MNSIYQKCLEYLIYLCSAAVIFLRYINYYSYISFVLNMNKNIVSSLVVEGDGMGRVCEVSG